MSTQHGWERFAAADWAAARDAFAEALEEDPSDPDALDGLGQSLWWLGERDAGIEKRREAYAAFRRRGDPRGAGRLAAYLAGRVPHRRAQRRGGGLARAGAEAARGRRPRRGVHGARPGRPGARAAGGRPRAPARGARRPAPAPGEARGGREAARRARCRTRRLAPLVRLHVERGEVEVARALLERRGAAPMASSAAVAAPPNDGDEGGALAAHAAAPPAALDDPELLLLWAELALAEQDLDAVASLAEQLHAAARRLDRPDLDADAAALAGRVALARGDTARAVTELEAAVSGFAAVHYPLEEARARLALARAEAAEGSPLAPGSARAARDAFAALGARRPPRPLNH